MALMNGILESAFCGTPTGFVVTHSGRNPGYPDFVGNPWAALLYSFGVRRAADAAGNARGKPRG